MPILARLAPALLPAGLHLLSAGLLYRVASGLGIGRRAAVYSAVVYLTFFAQFDALFGLQASRHLQSVVLFLLLALCLQALPRRTLLWACLLFSAVAIFRGGIVVLTPFLIAVSSFLQPVQAALEMDPVQPHYPIPPQIGLWSLLVALGLAARLGASWREGSRAAPLLLAWYLFCVVYFLKQVTESLPILPSRAFIVLSPIFAVVFAEALVALYERIRAAAAPGRRTGEWVLAGIFLSLCLANLLAIPVAQFRGRLANDPAFDGNAPSHRATPFELLYQRGITEFRRGREPEALELLRQAAVAKPVLLRALLGPCRLSDLRWITAPLDLRGRLRQIRESRGHVWQASFDALQREISEYALCLFSISYLEARGERLEASRAWMTQLRYLERDPERLAAWIGQVSADVGNPSLTAFAERLRDPSILQDPLPWRKDDYGFGLFVLRLVTGRDIRSTWDRQTGIPI